MFLDQGDGPSYLACNLSFTTEKDYIYKSRAEAREYVGNTAYRFDHFGEVVDIPNFEARDLTPDVALLGKLVLRLVDDESTLVFPPFSGGGAAAPNLIAKRYVVNTWCRQLRAMVANLGEQHYAASSSRVAESPAKRWIVDTGAALDLAGLKEVQMLRKLFKHADAPLIFSTANGLISSDDSIDLWVSELDELVAPYILADTPSALSVGCE